MTDNIKASICAALMRAESTGKDLCFIQKDVLAEVLRDATARVLQLQEIPEWEGSVWLEHREVKDYIEQVIYRYEQQPFFRFAGKEHTWGIDMSTGSYNIDWRVWTRYPTEAERREVAWKC